MSDEGLSEPTHITEPVGQPDASGVQEMRININEVLQVKTDDAGQPVMDTEFARLTLGQMILHSEIQQVMQMLSAVLMQLGMVKEAEEPETIQSIRERARASRQPE